MKFSSTHALLGVWTTAALITTGASAGLVTVTDSLGATVYASANTTAALTDAMDWVNTHSGNYGVHAQSGRYDAGTTISNRASLTWGNSPGVIDLMGGMNVQASAQMLFEIAGTNNSNAPTTGVVDYDTVLADGNVTYFGTLSVALLSPYTPVLGNSFQLIATTFGKTVTWSGTLAAPTLAPGLAWQVSVAPSTNMGSTYTGQSLYLTVVPAPGALALLATAGIIGARRRRN
jgi:hypothetical protein